MTEILEKRHAILVTEFDRYVIEHPEFAEKIPSNAQVVLQIEGDEEYNEWSRKLVERQKLRRPKTFHRKPPVIEKDNRSQYNGGWRNEYELAADTG